MSYQGAEELDLNLLNHEGEGALHKAVRSLKLALLDALVEAKADVDLGERSAGKRPLHLAVEMGDLEAARVLLSAGAVVDGEAMDGSTPLHWAVLYRQEPLILALVQADADPDKQSAVWAPAESEAEPTEGSYPNYFT